MRDNIRDRKDKMCDFQIAKGRTRNWRKIGFLAKKTGNFMRKSERKKEMVTRGNGGIIWNRGSGSFRS